MSLPTINIAIAHPSVTFHPTTLDQAWTGTGGLKDLITASLQGSYTPYVIGSTVPSVGDQDKIWQKLDGAGRPIGAYKYYSGNWVKVYTHPIGTIVMFTGDPSGLFDGTGLGILGTDWYGFALANGNNGTPNLSDKFVVGAKMDNSGTMYSSGWQTTITGTAAKTGGSNEITLTSDNTYLPAFPALVVGKWGADGNAASTSGNLNGDVNADAAKNKTLIGAIDGNQSPDPISIIPTFFSCAYCCFIGYP